MNNFIVSPLKCHYNFFFTQLQSQMTRAKFTLVDPLTGGGRGVRFADVAGLKEVKIEVMEFIDYLKRPEHYKKLGAKVCSYSYLY